MKHKLIIITLFFAAIILLITGSFFFRNQPDTSADRKGEQIIALNEIEHLIQSGHYETAAEMTARLQADIQQTEYPSEQPVLILPLSACCLLFLIVVFFYIYFAMLRPFDKLQTFAEQIAQGNLNLPLHYERSNYFGQFTWAFDSMRQEITKARACEREAIENNKTVIATLSHDIKTPIASIRAYAEGLEANLDTTPEKRQNYVAVLTRKCDEVARLTDDLFLHSLSNLDKLKINPTEFELCSYMQTAIHEIAAEQKDIIFHAPDFTAMVNADQNRLLQIAENLINNARKYAKTRIDVSLTHTDDSIQIRFRDYGSGIPDKDMPFIFDKFYRGGNCGAEAGSGLGLYIVKYIAEQMNGGIQLHNHTDGLEAIVYFPVKFPYS
ncbi:MAG: HAMP domain-containing histidine kinase [Lachnospiraceae bacterium]|nr:HAMP domain-containing histidine kinase [Lachnospiraceae bacterium]